LSASAKNSWQHIIREMAQILAVGSDPLAAGLTAGNDDAFCSQRDRRPVAINKRIPNMSFKFT